MEPYLSNGELVSQDAWRSYIASLKAQTIEVAQEELPAAFVQLQEAIEHAVLARVQGKENIGLLFSGGVDSTLIGFILKKHNIPFTAYTAGFYDEGTKEPEDIVESTKAAAELGFVQKKIFDQ